MKQGETDKNILVFTAFLSNGGISSYAIPLVNELAKDHMVTLLYSGADGDKLSRIDPRVRCVLYSSPGNKAIFGYMIKRMWLHHIIRVKTRARLAAPPTGSIQRVAYSKAMILSLPDEIKQTNYDIAISTAAFCSNDVVAIHFKAKKKVAWIHSDYSALHADIAFDRIVLDQYDYIASVSESTRDKLVKCIPDYASKALYIPNLLDYDRIRKAAEEPPEEYQGRGDHRIIVTVSRIDNSSKRLDRVLKIAKELRKQNEKFHWYIVGGGKDYAQMSSLIESEGLQSDITMLGNRDNPYPYVKYADLFALTSQFEGRPLAVDEAIALGCPVIVTNYTSAKEQVKPEYGFVIENDDQTIAEEFCSKLDWATIDALRKKNTLTDSGEQQRELFHEKMKVILEN